MRMSFDVDIDEDAAHSTRETLVKRFGLWLDRHPEHGSAEPWDVDLLLSWKLAYGDRDYGRWTRADVDEVLLEHLPRKLSAAPDEAASIPSSLAGFVAFLDEEGLLDKRGDPAEVVAARALAQRRAFLDAMDDPASFGMAKRVFGFAGLEDGATSDQAAIEAAIAIFNDLPFEQRGAIPGLDEPGDLDLPPLPLRDTVPIDALAALADGVPVLRKVDALHAALGPGGAKLTKAGNLTLADGRRLVAATGVADRVEGVRSTTDMPRLFALGQVAQIAGAATVSGGRLRTVETWSTEPLAARWQRLVDAVIGAGAATLNFGAAIPMPLQLAELADQMTPHILATLWIADEPMPVQAFVEMMEEAATIDGPLGTGVGFLGRDHVASMCRARVADVLTTLVDAGVITVGPGGPKDLDAEVTFTAAGPRVAAPSLAEVGFGVLLPEEITRLDAAGLIDALFERDSDDAALAARLWASGRSKVDAARQLAAEIEARPEPARVLVGFSLLQHLGTEAADAVRPLLDGPLAGHAWLFLADQGAVDGEDAPAHLLVQTGIDLFIATADLGTPVDVIEMLLGNIPADEHEAFIDTLASTDHPRTGDILDLLGRHHPDETTATHARKAALRWRTHAGDARRASP
jgi:hypothetical protein